MIGDWLHKLLICGVLSKARSVRIYLDESRSFLNRRNLVFQASSFDMEHEIQQLVDMVLLTPVNIVVLSHTHHLPSRVHPLHKHGPPSGDTTMLWKPQNGYLAEHLMMYVTKAMKHRCHQQVLVESVSAGLSPQGLW